MKHTKLLCLLLALVLLLSLFTGCGSSSADTEETEEETESSEEAAAETSETEEETEDADESEVETSDSGSALPDSYPLICDDGSISLTMFQIMLPFMTEIEDFNDLYWFQQLSELTGITFDWNMVAMAAAEDQFNLLVAAGDLPNIVCTLNYYNESISYAAENEVFVDLSGYLEDYAPDYWALVSGEDVYSIVSDENGSIIAFYELGYEDSYPNSGAFIRGDLLEEQGLDVPVTYDDYEETLLALKTAYDIEAPLNFYTDNYGGDWLSAGKGVQYDFSLDEEGNCIYGPITDEYREFLSTVNRWYEEGLINEGFYADVTIASGDLEDALIAGTSITARLDAESVASLESQLEDGQYFVPGYMPRDNEDDVLHLQGSVTDKVNLMTGWALGTTCTEEQIQAACMLINYFYTDAGSEFVCYGVEGVSFEYDENGDPWYSEMITDNPDGLTQIQAVVTYLGNNVPTLTDWSRNNISALSTMTEYLDCWAIDDNSQDMPQVTLTVEESEEYAAVSTDVETYLDEALNKFIRGDLDVDDDAEWQNYLDNMSALGVDTMVEIYTDALERYNAR